jgi:NADPH:quinone reductase
MRAIVIVKPGGPEVLELRDVPTPEPAKGEVRIRVHACAVNRADVLQRLGGYPAPPDSPAHIPGLEFAGEVEALGPGVMGLVKGDRVFGLVGGGAYAEYLIAHERTVAKVPTNVSFTEAAAIPEAFLTAYDAMVSQCHLAAGEIVLVQAVGSGVGTAAVQIARAIGARSIGTARTADKLERAKLLGLDAGICVHHARFADDVLALTHGHGVDVVLELIGGDYVPQDLLCVAPTGRIVLVGLIAGTHANLDLGMLLRKRVMLKGTVLRSRPLEEKIAAAHVLARNIAPLVARGEYKAVIEEVLPLAEARRAHELMQSNSTFGKLVLAID